MPTDATGTPTSLGIRKYNTSVDAPSGLGFNGAMDDIDALLVARTKALTATGDLLFASAANTPARLPIGTTGQVLAVVGGLPAWAAAGATTYRKSTAKAVNTSTAATDLLNGEITIGANVMGTTGRVRLTASGDLLQNSGGAAVVPRFQLIFGGTTLFDTGTAGSLTIANGATRGQWKLIAEIANLNAAGSQEAQFRLDLYNGGNVFAASNGAAFTTGQGRYGVLDIGVNFLALATGMTTSALDTTTAKALVLNTINGSASASYETKLYSALAEVI